MGPRQQSAGAGAAVERAGSEHGEDAVLPVAGDQGRWQPEPLDAVLP